MSSRNRIDPRVLRTRKLLRDALVELISKRGFASLTIGEITDAATLNRATFYLHYTDKNDLLVDVFDDLLGTAVPDPPDAFAPSPGDVGPILAIFLHVAQYADFYRVMLGEEGAPGLMARAQTLIERIALKWMTAVQPEPEKAHVPQEVAVNYLASAYLGVIAWWLNAGMPYSPEEMSAQLMRMTALGIHNALGVERPPG